MNRSRLWISVLLGAWLALPQLVFAETVKAESKVVEVTVFPDRALVTRRAEVNLEVGLHQVELASLPGTIEEGSVSAKGRGEARVTIFGVEIETAQLEEPQSEKVKELEKAIRDLEDKKRELLDTKKVMHAKHRFLGSIQAASTKQIGKDIVTKQPQVAEIAGILAFIEQELAASFKKELEQDIEGRKLDQELDKLRRDMADLRWASGKQTKAICVDLEAETAGPFSLEVSYRLPEASWEPAYEARAGSQDAKVNFVAYGVVRQRTGEEWEGVSLTLSTAKPSIGGRMPEVEPWFIKRKELERRRPPLILEEGLERKRNAMRVGAYQEAALYSQAPAADEAQITEAQAAQSLVETKGPAVLFKLPKPETIASDWRPRKVSIAQLDLPVELAYETSPRLSPFAYLRGKVKNVSEGLLLAGPVQVFLDEAYIGNSSIDLTGHGERFDLYLGTDERLKVERRLMKEKVDVSVLAGLHGKIKSIDYEYLTTLENFRPAPAEVTLVDQIPVSKHDEIKIDNVTFEPGPGEEDPEKPGVRRWKFTLPPAGKQAVRLSYKVKYPVDFDVEGL